MEGNSSTMVLVTKKAASRGGTRKVPHAVSRTVHSSAMVRYLLTTCL